MSEEYNTVTCNSCGIEFKFQQKIEDLWRKSGKTFYCPNGHGLVWNKPKVSPEEEEIKSLKVEVKELKVKLDAALKDAESQKKRADELATELEIWRPSTTEEQKVG